MPRKGLTPEERAKVAKRVAKKRKAEGAETKPTGGHPRGWVNPNPVTPENRKMKGSDICGAKRTGKSSSGPGICCKPAGWGTDHVGYGACRLHAGDTPQHNKHAVMLKLMEEASFLGDPIDVSPDEALLQEVHRTAGHVHYLNALIQFNDALDESVYPLKTLMEWYHAERGHLVQVSKACLQAGIAERHLQLAEEQGKLLAMVLQAFVRDPELALTPEQRVLAPTVIRRHLTSIPAQSTEVVKNAPAQQEASQA